jgi:chromosome segregation ATPase
MNNKNSSSSKLTVSQQLEEWTKQQREFRQAAAAANSEREKLMGRLTEIKSNTTKIRQATLQAKDTLGKHHMVCRQLQAKKKQLERQLQDERAQSEACAAQLATVNTTALTFQKQAADQYHTLNKEIAQVNKEFMDDITKSYITVASVHLLEKAAVVTTAAVATTTAAGTATDSSQRVDTAALYADMKKDLVEVGRLENTRAGLMAKVKKVRARALESSKHAKNPVRTYRTMYKCKRRNLYSHFVVVCFLTTTISIVC